MIIKSITLFNVPIDNTYKNVFDNGDFSTAGNVYDDFLYAMFPYRAVASEIEKAVKVVNNDCLLTIYLKYEVATLYNYARIIDGENKIKYFFITGYVSQNDGARASCSINLEFDVWHNHLSDLQTESNFDENFITRRHDVRFTNYTSNIERVYNCEPENISSPKQLTVEHDINGGKYRVLWLAIRSDGSIENSSGYGRGVVSNQSATPIFYAPLVLFDTSGNPLQSFYITDGIKTIYGPTNLYNLYTLDKTQFLSAWLTYYSPFNYTISDNTISIENTHAHLFCPQDSKSTPLDSERYLIGGPGYEIANAYTRLSLSLSGYGYFSILKSDPEFANISSTETAAYSPAESKFYTFPFNYSKIVMRDFEYILRNVGNIHDTVMYIDMKAKTEPTITFFAHNKNITKATFIKNPSQAILSSSKLDEFLRNSSESAYTGLFLSMIKGAIAGVGVGAVGGPAAGIIGAAGSIVGSAITFSAQLNDLEKQQDNFSIPSYIANNDTYYQDNVFQYDVIMYDEYEIKTLLSLFQKQGYTINAIQSIRKNNRYWFDYVQTQECYLPFISTLLDRKQIETIYDNGVTKWHINKVGSTLIALDNFDYTRNNPERTIKTTPTVGTLNKVIGVSISNNILTWDSVVNAELYHILVNGVEQLSQGALSYDLSLIIDQTTPASYTITIYASADGYTSGEQSDGVIYTVAPQLSSPTGLTITETNYGQLGFVQNLQIIEE